MIDPTVYPADALAPLAPTTPFGVQLNVLNGPVLAVKTMPSGSPLHTEVGDADVSVGKGFTVRLSVAWAVRGEANDATLTA